MGRPIQGILLTAALGSLAGTLGLSLMCWGIGSLQEARLAINFSLITMIFTVPGATMLVGLQDILLERRLPKLFAGTLIVLAGAAVGASVLGIFARTPEFTAIGGFYGALTATALLAIQILPAFNPAAAR